MAIFSLDFGGADPSDLLPGVHAGHDQSGGLVALIDHFLAAITRDGPGSWNLLGGVETLGTNLHPLVLHFPIAFLMGFFLVELYGLLFRNRAARQLASGLLYLGAFGAVVTAASGLIAAETVPHGARVHDIMEWHERAGLTVASLSVALALWRRIGGIPHSSMALALSLMLSGLMSLILFLGADLGGMMVYRHGVGVQSLQTNEEHHHHLHDSPDTEVATPASGDTP